MDSLEHKWNGLVIEILSSFYWQNSKSSFIYPLNTFRVLPIGPIKKVPAIAPNKFTKISSVDVYWEVD